MGKLSKVEKSGYLKKAKYSSGLTKPTPQQQLVDQTPDEFIRSWNSFAQFYNDNSVLIFIIIAIIVVAIVLGIVL